MDSGQRLLFPSSVVRALNLQVHLIIFPVLIVLCYYVPLSAQNIAVSLSTLQKRITEGKDYLSDAEIMHLAGLNWLDGYLIDYENKDIILFGEKKSSRPPLDLDDLVVAIQNIWHTRVVPTCSIDPRQQDLKRMHTFIKQAMVRIRTHPNSIDYHSKQWAAMVGPQDVHVDGIPGACRLARVLVESDYLMKKIVVGNLKVEKTGSYLDFVEKMTLQELKNPGSSTSPIKIMSRFWFYPQEESPSYYITKNMLRINKFGIQLLTEEEYLDRFGLRTETGQPEENAAQFARAVTHNFAALTEQYTIFADLENIFRLISVLSALYRQNAETQAGLNLEPLMKKHTLASYEVPTTLPGLNGDRQLDFNEGNQEFKTWIPISGGVVLKFDVSNEQFKDTSTTELALLEHSILANRPSTESVSWQFKTQDESLNDLDFIQTSLQQHKTLSWIKTHMPTDNRIIGMQYTSQGDLNVLFKEFDELVLLKVDSVTVQNRLRGNRALYQFDGISRNLCSAKSNNENIYIHFAETNDGILVQAPTERFILSKVEAERFLIYPQATEFHDLSNFIKNIAKNNRIFIFVDGLAQKDGTGNYFRKGTNSDPYRWIEALNQYFQGEIQFNIWTGN